MKIVRVDNEFLPFTKDRAIDMLDTKIKEAEHALQDAKDKKEYFLKYYNKYFREIENE